MPLNEHNVFKTFSGYDILFRANVRETMREIYASCIVRTNMLLVALTTVIRKEVIIAVSMLYYGRPKKKYNFQQDTKQRQVGSHMVDWV